MALCFGLLALVCPTVSAGGGDDDCATAESIAGSGTFAFDQTAASTGGQGQSETLCYFFGSKVVDNDVWFAWQADADGIATVTTCGGTGTDTKIAAYPGSGCPAPSTALACNDDDCGGQSTISFDCTNGTTYTLQIGTFPGEAGGSGTFDVSIDSPPLNGSDACQTMTPIAGQGVFPFDLFNATTGTKGQDESLCYSLGSTAIDADIWYSWTADDTGMAFIDTCGGQTIVNTKLSAYPGAACPTSGTSIACNDNLCGSQSGLHFPVVQGAQYTLQVGTAPGASAADGTFTISILEPACGYRRDDGEADGAIGIIISGQLGYLNMFTAEGGADVLNQVAVAYGAPNGPGDLEDRDVTIAIYDDPTNDFDPSDAVLLYSFDTSTINVETSILNHYTVPNIAVNGVFCVLAVVETSVTALSGAFDYSAPSDGKAWTTGALGPNFDFDNLANNDLPLQDMESFGNDATFLIRAFSDATLGCESIGTDYCDPAVPNSTGVAGQLHVVGSDVVADQDLRLKGSDLPANKLCLFLASQTQGFIQQPGVSAGNFCLGAPFARFNTQAQNSGPFGFATIDVDMTHIRTSPPQPILAGQTWNFQLWHRDSGGTSNFTQGVEVLFQ